MKKISLGSFPLVQLPKTERKMIDSYLVKVLSDLITVNQLSNSIYMDRVRYITPLSIMEYIKENKNRNTEANNPDSDSMDNERISKSNIIRNAFKNTKNLYRALSNDPFYRTNIFFPIYIEEPIKSSSGYMDYNYDFLILSNDLVRQQILDEIIYDDKITLLFLVLKCIISPNLKLTEIGNQSPEGSGFRKHFSVFLETCKNENINPFDMFIKIIKAAGYSKRINKVGALASLSNKYFNNSAGGVESHDTSFASLTNRLVGNSPKAASFHSDAFLKLFNNYGEIKDASFLTSINLNKINNYLQEVSKVENYNPMLRQYTQAKTHEYGKILSIVDALISFNKSNNVLEEINSNTIISKIQIGSNTGAETTLNINKEVIINELETVLFRSFLDEIGRLDKMRISLLRNDIKDKFKIDIFGNESGKTRQSKLDLPKIKEEFIKTKELFINKTKDVVKVLNTIGMINLREDEKQKFFTDNVNNNPRKLPIIDEYNKIAQNAEALRQSIAQLSGMDTGLKEALVDIRTGAEVSLKINLEILQSQLSTIYSELYEYIYSTEFDSDISRLNSVKKTQDELYLNLLKNAKSSILSKMLQTVSELTNVFGIEAEMNYKKYIADEKSQEPDSTKVYNFKSDSLKIDETKIQMAITKTILLPIFIKYSNQSVSNASQIKDMKTNNNPLIKRLLSDKNSFKAFILTEEVLVHAYELLHYLDTVKYEEGVIGHPVSSVTNKQNQILFMLTRLGLDSNPVFIFSSGKILLSMPSHLSMTGINFLSSISMQDFAKIGHINYTKDLWEQEGMFGGMKQSIKFKQAQSNINKIKIEIKAATEELKNAKDQKERKRKEAEIARKKKELLDNQAKFDDQNSYDSQGNFTSNMNMFKRDDNNREMFGPRVGGRYDANMDPNGNYRHQNQTVADQRNNMDRLKQQNVYPSQQSYPPNRYIPNQGYQNNNVGNNQNLPTQHNQYTQHTQNTQINQPNNFNDTDVNNHQPTRLFNNPNIINRQHELYRR